MTGALWLGGMRGGGESYTASMLSSQLSSPQYLESYAHPKLASALAERRLVRLSADPELWVFMGRSRDYLIIPRTYCSCRDFLVNVVGRGRPRPCYHLVAQAKANETGIYRDLVGLDWRSVWVIVLEILDRGVSRALRRALGAAEQP